MSFHNKVILITGGSSGIGAATAFLFTKEGASVAIVGRNASKLKTVSKQCETVGKKPLTIQANVSNDEETKTIIKKVIDAFGKLDILINNAGITASGTILRGNLLEDYDRVLSVNLRAAVHLTILSAPFLIETKGNIVNISSVSGSSFLGKPTVMSYAISKAGLDHFTRGAALELYQSGVRVNAVTPGPVRSDILKSNGINKSWEDVMVAFGLNRVSEPEEVADLIAFLASDKARGITGSNYLLDNGALVVK